MNEYQYALNRVEVALDNRYSIDCETLDVLQELVDRATPMKPIITRTDVHCKKCQIRIGDNNGWIQAMVKYCKFCGQALDWSE